MKKKRKQKVDDVAGESQENKQPDRGGRIKVSQPVSSANLHVRFPHTHRNAERGLNKLERIQSQHSRPPSDMHPLMQPPDPNAIEFVPYNNLVG